jgi:hypothetical protein
VKRLLGLILSVALIVDITNALAASDKAKQRARRECIKKFGGTTELLRVDKNSGYIYCRNRRQVERIPLQIVNNKKPKPKTDTAEEQPPQAADSSGATKSTKPCQNCSGQNDDEVASKPGANLDPRSTPMDANSRTPPNALEQCQDCAARGDRQDTPVPGSNASRQPQVPSTEVVSAPEDVGISLQYPPKVLEQARTICIKQYGPKSDIDYIDPQSWNVVCKKP